MNIAENTLATILSRAWWTLLVRGLVAVAFAVLTWLQPGISLTALVLLFGWYALADGLLGVWAAIAGRQVHENWWVLLLWGLLGVGVGILTFVAPGITALVLLFYIAPFGQSAPARSKSWPRSGCAKRSRVSGYLSSPVSHRWRSACC